MAFKTMHPKLHLRRSFCGATLTTFASLASIAAGSTIIGGVPRLAHAGSAKQVLILGDSMIAGAFGLFLERALRKTLSLTVHRRGKSSTGLARPDFFDWQKEAAELVGAHQPAASIVMFGGNDVQGLYMGRDDNKQRAWIRWPDDGWPKEYARRVNELCDTLAPAGQPIYWIGLPIMRPDKFRTRCEKVNRIYRAEMAIRANGTFVDTWGVLAGEDGEYADRISIPKSDGDAPPKRVRVRAGDGIHLSPAGAEVMVDHVLAAIGVDLAALASR